MSENESARPDLKFCPTRYRVRARDAEAGGSACQSGCLTLEGAWEWVDWLRGFGARFTVIRIEATREALIGPAEEKT